MRDYLPMLSIRMMIYSAIGQGVFQDLRKKN
jgi:hypothetical protein